MQQVAVHEVAALRARVEQLMDARLARAVEAIERQIRRQRLSPAAGRVARIVLEAREEPGVPARIEAAVVGTERSASSSRMSVGPATSASSTLDRLEKRP